MSTQTLVPTDVRETPAAADAPAEPRRRGTLTMAEKVFEKIAGQAAADVAASRGRTGGVLGIGSHADADARPQVAVNFAADSADLSISVGIAYPGSIRQATQQIREQVAERVQQLTGVPVHRVDIDVTFLTVAGAGEQRTALR